MQLKTRMYLCGLPRKRKLGEVSIFGNSGANGMLQGKLDNGEIKSVFEILQGRYLAYFEEATNE